MRSQFYDAAKANGCAPRLLPHTMEDGMKRERSLQFVLVVVGLVKRKRQRTTQTWGRFIFSHRFKLAFFARRRALEFFGGVAHAYTHSHLTSGNRD
jgi:hypothetical protein